jgi:hypothetical protein
MQVSGSELLTLIVALYGAVLSTILGVREIRRGRRRVRVMCCMALGVAQRDVLEFIQVTAVNVGYRPVEIVAAGLLMSDGAELQPEVGDETGFSASPKRMPAGVNVQAFAELVDGGEGPSELPKKIGDGESVQVLINYSGVERMLEEQRKKASGVTLRSAFARDSEGNLYKGRLPKVLRGGRLA